MRPWMLRDAIGLCWVAAVVLTLVGFYTFVLGEWAPSYPLLIGAGMAILLGTLTVRPLWHASIIVLGFALLVVLAFYLKTLTVA